MPIKKTSKIMVVVSLCSLLVACSSGGGGGDGTISQSKSYIAETADMDYSPATSENNPEPKEAARRQIKRYNIEADSKTFDKTYAGIKALLPKYKGYVDNASFSNSNTKRISTNMRVPSTSVQDFIEEIKKVEGFNLLSESESTTDVENNYVDVEKRLTALNKRLEKLYELQENEKNIDRILDIETRLQDTISSIEELEGTKQGLDRDVTYSEVDLLLKEVYTGNKKNEPTEAPFGEELAGVVKDTGKTYRGLAKGILFTLIYLSPIIIIIVVLNKFVFKKKITGKKILKKLNPTNVNKPQEKSDEKE